MDTIQETNLKREVPFEGVVKPCEDTHNDEDGAKEMDNRGKEANEEDERAANKRKEGELGVAIRTKVTEGAKRSDVAIFNKEVVAQKNIKEPLCIKEPLENQWPINMMWI